MKYYIVNSEEIEMYTPNMVSSFGHANIFIRKSIDEAFGLMEFTEELAPEGYTGYTVEEIREIMLTPEWAVNGIL